MTDNGSDRGDRPRVMLLAPVPMEVPAAVSCLRALAATAPVAAVLLPAGKGGARAWQERLREQARVLSVACLVMDDVSACLALEADGVLLHDVPPAEVRRARARLGREGIIGVCCPTRRHALMELGEAGADWLGVDQRMEAAGENLLAWAAEMITLPLAAMQPAPPEEVARLVALGADFVVPVPEVWESERKAMDLAAAYAAALAA